MASKIDTLPKRSRLKPKNEPYFELCGPMQYVGYRRALTDERSAWYARVYTGSGYKTARLDLPTGTTPEAAFEVARRAAQEHAELVRNGAVASRTDTVLAAVLAYVDHVREDERRPVAAVRMMDIVNRTIVGQPIAGAPLATLQAPMFTAWRREMSKGRASGMVLASSTVNRQMTVLRAALRWSIERKLLASDTAFAVALKPIKNADGKREVYLDKAQREKLLAALDKAEPTLGKLAKLLTLLPLRPGAAAALTVADLDLKGGRLVIRKDKTLTGNETRTIGLPASARAFLIEQAKGKLPTAPLLPNAHGGHWTARRWAEVLREVLAEVKGLPEGTILYTLRHSLLTDLANGGAPLAAVAQLAGTSIAQLDKHYFQGANDAALAAIERIAG